MHKKVHVESTEGTSERTSVTIASCHCDQLACIEQILVYLKPY